MRVAALLIILAPIGGTAAALATGPARVTSVAGLKAALGRLQQLKVSELPPEVLRRDGYGRRHSWRRALRVTPEQRHIVLVGDKTVEDFLSPEYRFPDSWLYTSLRVPRAGDVYLLLDKRLPLKLLHIVRRLRARGYEPDAFIIISAFRTERVNRHIHAYRKRTWGQSSVANRSLHLVGRAMDLVIDDLNRDGRVDGADHRAMVCAIRAVERRHPRLSGGLGLYAKSVHTDIRRGSKRANWCGKGGNKSPLCGRPLRCR